MKKQETQTPDQKGKVLYTDYSCLDMKNKDIDYWIERLKEWPIERIQKRLNDTLTDIQLLESMYMTGGKLSYFSDSFKEAAYGERQALCQLSSACYDLLRSKQID